jgi:hypothetical protein
MTTLLADRGPLGLGFSRHRAHGVVPFSGFEVCRDLGDPIPARPEREKRYPEKPIFSMWTLSVGVIAEPTTFLFMR